ncbi:TorF family putative porin [Caulobacter sp. DWR1-3-2b1]|uniref:TorF family putative porin n=1 Tax=Caulobacter sp. DWR1-3-2b1 TaxID=2804670 RepID=UPI003CF27121
MYRFLSGVILTVTPFAALAAEPAAMSLDYELGVVSDYRYRGLSLSDERPALQGGVTASLASGFYGSVRASTTDEYCAGADGEGATVEVDYAAGWASAIAGMDVDVAVTRYTYPGGEDVAYFEFPVTVAKSWNACTAKVGGAYAPRQKALGTEGDGYGFGRLEWSASSAPVTLAVQAGYETGAFAPGGKWDWSTSAAPRFGPVNAELGFIDSDRAGRGLVAGLKAAF